LAANFGSFDSLKVFARWGFRANFSGTAGQQRVLRSYLEKVSVPLPPLDEQRRIVGLLDRTAEIRRRAEAARAIIPALFLDTFGDPATKPKGWGRLIYLGSAQRAYSAGDERGAPAGSRSDHNPA
jgi:hypothetical protein